MIDPFNPTGLADLTRPMDIQDIRRESEAERYYRRMNAELDYQESRRKPIGFIGQLIIALIVMALIGAIWFPI